MTTDTLRTALERIAGTSGLSPDAKICREIARAALAAAPQPAPKRPMQYTNCDECGKLDLPHDEAVWADDEASSFCPSCRPDIAPQPVPVDREALVEVMKAAVNNHPADGRPYEHIADALLARGLRLPGEDALQQLADLGQQEGRSSETMATKIREAAAQSRDVFSGSCDHTRQGIDYMEQLLLSGIRVVEGGDDAA